MLFQTLKYNKLKYHSIKMKKKRPNYFILRKKLYLCVSNYVNKLKRK